MILNENWRNALLLAESTIHDAIRVLNDTSLKIVLIASEAGVLIGTITDGDIRRGLLIGIDINDSVVKILNPKPIFVDKYTSQDRVREIMSTSRIYQIPILDHNMILVGMHIWDDINFPIKRENMLVIMAGGKGTRLLPKTLKTPKPMLPLAGRPILEHIIFRARNQGFNNIVIAIQHLGESIETYFGTGGAFGVDITYLRENLPLGTAGALSLLPKIPDREILVTNGDLITDVRFDRILDFHIHHEAAGTMAVQHYNLINPFGVVKTRGLEIIGFEEKPINQSLINTGIYVLDPLTLTYLDKSSPCNMPELFEKIRSKGHKTYAYPIHEHWTDIGEPKDYIKASEEFLDSGKII